MDIFSVLTMVGGLALFLYGMQVMGDGLAKVSGGKLERILEKCNKVLLEYKRECQDEYRVMENIAWCRCDGCDSVVIGDDRYGCRIC